MNPDVKRIVLAIAIIAVPGSSIVVGSYLLFKGINAILDKDQNKEKKDEKTTKKTGEGNPDAHSSF